MMLSQAFTGGTYLLGCGKGG